MKTCKQCRTEKPGKDFYSHSGARDGLRGECKECTSARRGYTPRSQKPPKKVCKIDGCERLEEGVRHGICKSHMQRIRNGGWDSLYCLFCGSVRPLRGRCGCLVCRAAGCWSPVHQRGLCKAHYMRLYRSGAKFDEVPRCDCGQNARSRNSKYCIECRVKKTKEIALAKENRRRTQVTPAPRKDYSMTELTALDSVCYLCRGGFNNDASVDHILPLSRGGVDRFVNVALAHKRCNSKKNAKFIWELGSVFPNAKVPIGRECRRSFSSTVSGP